MNQNEMQRFGAHVLHTDKSPSHRTKLSFTDSIITWELDFGKIFFLARASVSQLTSVCTIGLDEADCLFSAHLCSYNAALVQNWWNSSTAVFFFYKSWNWFQDIFDEHQMCDCNRLWFAMKLLITSIIGDWQTGCWREIEVVMTAGSSCQYDTEKWWITAGY